MKKAIAMKKLRRFGSIVLWTFTGMFGGDPAEMVNARPAPEPDEPTSEETDPQ